MARQSKKNNEDIVVMPCIRGKDGNIRSLKKYTTFDILCLTLQVLENFLVTNALFLFWSFRSYFNAKQSLVNMPRLNPKERTKIIEFWYQIKNVKQLQRLFCGPLVSTCVMRQIFKPSKLLTIAKFTNDGTVYFFYKGRSGRQTYGGSKDSVDMVRQAVVRSPKKSNRRVSAETNLRRYTVQRIVRQHINAFLYKIQIKSLLTYEQKEKRFHFANWYAEKLEEDADFPKKLHITDECHAHLSEVANKQKFWYRKTENPSDASTAMVPRSILKDTMWVTGG